MSKSKLRIKARKLRSDGLGIKTIAHSLRVSSSTVSLWCRDIKLTHKQIAVLEKRSHDPFYGKRLMHVLKQQKIRELKTHKLIQRAIKHIGSLSQREMFTAGVALYWAEGFKKDS